MLSFVQHRRIEWGDCDPAGIVFNPRYFAFFDHGAAMLFEKAGWPKPQLISAFNIIGLPLVETSARFLAPCAFGDEVRITSEVMQIGRSSFKIRHQLLRGDLLCVEGTETRVWTAKDPDGRLCSAPVPDIVRERLSAPAGA